MTQCATFEPEVGSVRAARHLVRELVSVAGGDGDVAELVTSELATSAVVHAGTPFTVSWEQRGSVIRIEVVNHAPEMVVHLVDGTDGQGRGLAIVEHLATSWGTEVRPDAKVVWFELPVSAVELSGTRAPRR